MRPTALRRNPNGSSYHDRNADQTGSRLVSSTILSQLVVKIAGQTHYLWRAIDHEGEVLEAFVTKTKDKTSALKFHKAMKRWGTPSVIVTDGLSSYRQWRDVTATA